MNGSPHTTVYLADVLTMDPDRPRATALAVAGERIVAVGSLADVLGGAGASATVVELDGVILPGLIDAHLHMQRAGLKALSYLPPGADVDAFIVRMRETFDDEDWAGAAPPTPAARLEAIRVIQPLMHALGITGVVDPAATPDELRAYVAARRRGMLTMRTVAMPYLEIGSPETPDVEAVIARLDGTGVGTGLGDDHLRLGPIKVYADGEALKGEAYLEEPWDTGGYRGLQRISDADLARLVSWCADHGWGVGTHAVGSAAITAVARAYQAAGDAVREHRFQFIHAYLEPSPQTLRLAAASGAIASLQPSIVWHNGAGLRAKLGARAESAGPVRSWLDAGATVAFGSDGPYFAFDPRHLMWQAVTRRVAGEAEPLSAAEAVTMREALAAYTTGAAVAAFAEHDRGALRPGAYADWALWSGDPTSVPIDEVRSLRVRRTDVGGRTVFEEGLR